MSAINLLECVKYSLASKQRTARHTQNTYRLFSFQFTVFVLSKKIIEAIYLLAIYTGPGP